MEPDIVYQMGYTIYDYTDRPMLMHIHIKTILFDKKVLDLSPNKNLSDKR